MENVIIVSYYEFKHNPIYANYRADGPDAYDKNTKRIRIVNKGRYSDYVYEVYEDRKLTPEERNGNPSYDRGVFSKVNDLVKKFGEVAYYREIKVRYHKINDETEGRKGGLEKIVFKNGEVVEISEDERISNYDGSYKNGWTTLLTRPMDEDNERPTFIIKFSRNGKFIRTASGEIVKRNGEWALHAMNPEIIKVY